MRIEEYDKICHLLHSNILMHFTKNEIGAQGMTNGKRETRNGKRENNKWKQNRMCDEVTDLGFVPIRYFPVSLFS